VPHLRRWVSGDAGHPALPGWATVFRASGAALRITDYRLQASTRTLSDVFSITSHERALADLYSAAPIRRFSVDRTAAPIPNRRRPSQSARGATDGSPVRKDWVRSRKEFRAPEVRHISDLAALMERRNRLPNMYFDHSSEHSEGSLRIQNKSRSKVLRSSPRAQDDLIPHSSTTCLATDATIDCDYAALCSWWDP
jgi:hypothetical protein